MIATQSILGAGGADDSTASSFQVPGFGSGGGGGGGNNPNNFFHGEVVVAASGSFAGVVRALLKSSSSSSPAAASAGGAGAAASKPDGAEKIVWQPRTALDLSGHSFSKALKAEISRSKQQKEDAKAAEKCKCGGMHTIDTSSISATTTKNFWWAKGGGRDLDDTGLSRVSSTSTLPPSPVQPQLPGPPRASKAMGSGSLKQQQQQQQQAGSMYRSRSYDGDFDMSLVVGLQ